MTSTKKDFLNIDYGEADLSKIKIESSISSILESRLIELKVLIQNKTPLSSVIMMGSILEGLLLAIASKYPKEFNMATSSPKNNNGSVKKLHDWTLNDFINVTYEIGGIEEDVQKFASSLDTSETIYILINK